MSDDRNGNSGKLAAMAAATAAWLIYDMATATEAPRQAVVILQYVLLGGALLGFVGSMAKYMSRP